MSDGAPFVGREHELGELLQRLNLASHGQGGVALLSGEPGIGKTRLAQEISALTEARGGTVLWGRCWAPEMGAPPFWPWVEALATCARTLDPGLLRSAVTASGPELGQLIPEFRTLTADLRPSEQGEFEEPEEARFRLFKACTEFLRQIAAAPTTATVAVPTGTEPHLLKADAVLPPLLVVLDDLHWADKASLLLLQYVARVREPLPFLVVGLYDDDALDQAHPLTSTIAGLNRETSVTRIELQGLKAGDVRALVEARLGRQRRTLARALAQELYQVTEGNPFFLTETLDDVLRSTQALDYNWQSTSAILDAGGLAIPTSVREVLERRLARLSDDAQRVLSVAAVIGRDFDAAILATAMAVDTERLDEALGEAEAAGTIMPDGYGERYRFRHAFVRKALYDSMGTRPRLRLHRLVAEVLEARSKDGLNDHVSELAYHFAQVGDIAKTRQYGRLAGERAEQPTAWEEASRQYETCLGLLGTEDSNQSAEKAELLVAMGRCSRNANDHRTAWRCLVQAISLCEEAGDGVSMASTALEALRIAAPPDRRDALAGRALGALRGADPRLEAQLQLQRGLWTASDGEEARSLRRAAELADQHGLADVATVLEQAEANRALRDGRPEEAHRIFIRLFESAIRLGRKGWALGFFINANSIAIFAGDLAEAKKVFDEPRVMLASAIIACARRGCLLGWPEPPSRGVNWIGMSRCSTVRPTSIQRTSAALRCARCVMKSLARWTAHWRWRPDLSRRVVSRAGWRSCTVQGLAFASMQATSPARARTCNCRSSIGHRSG